MQPQTCSRNISRDERSKMLGPKKLPKWLREAYKRAVNYTCEDCGEKEPKIKLDVHRIVQGYRGGTYRPGNVKVCCKGCHKKYADKW